MAIYLVFISSVMVGILSPGVAGADLTEAAVAEDPITYKTIVPEPKCQSRTYIEVRRESEVIKNIPCESSCDSKTQCYAFKVSEGGFLLVDNTVHEGKLPAFALSKYSNRGRLSRRFELQDTCISDIRNGNRT
jgi:hypothetical protein